jgi:sortase A
MSEEGESKRLWNISAAPRRRRPFGTLEWLLLLFGLVAVDTYLWVNTSSVMYQAYQDWAFDEKMRGLTPSVPRFAADEISWAFGGAHTKVENGDALRKFEPLPAERPPLPDAVIGRLRIPRLQLTVMVREGAGSGTLQRAVGHIPGTAMPGRAGNVALAGHRDTFFRPLRNIQKNDTIDLETEKGTYQYQVESTEIVGPRDVGVLAAANHRTLTLVTCYPFYYVGSAPKRFIVRAVQLNPEIVQPASLHRHGREPGRHAALTQHQPRPGS